MKKKSFSDIPEELKTNGKFCLHIDKIPHKKTPSGIYKARPNKIEDFKNFDEIIKDYQSTEEASGISINIHSNLCGIDIDNCYSESGSLSKTAVEIIKTIKSYTERSLSGKGIHILFYCENQKDIDSSLYYKNRHFKEGETGGLEIYQGNFDTKVFTISGDTIYKKISSIDFSLLQTIFDKYMKKTTYSKEETNQIESTPEEDIDFIEKGLEKDQLFCEIYNSNSELSSNQSETDFKLLSKLAFWSNKNENLMIDYFERSPYFQSKDEKHIQKWNRKDYKRTTIQNVLKGTTTTAKAKAEEFIKSKQGEEKEMKTNNQMKEFIQNNNILNQTDKFFETISGKTFKPYSTGFSSLDDKLNGGITNQSIFVLNGGSGTGKTTFMLNLCLNLIKERPVLYYTLEMSQEQIYSKVFSNIAYSEGGMTIQSSNILQSYDENKMTSYQKKALLETIKNQDKLQNFFVIFPEESTAEFLKKDIEEKLTYFKENGLQIPLIVIDYLQFVRSDKTEEPQSLIKRITRTFKKLSIDFETTFFLLSATARDKTKTGTKSQLDSGRDSSDIEFSSDYCLSLNFYSWEHETELKPQDRQQLIMLNPRKMTITIHKNRFGASGQMIDFIFNGETNTFTEDKGLQSKQKLNKL